MQVILSETSCFRDTLPMWDIPDMSGIDDLRGKELYEALIAFKPEGIAETEWAKSAGVNRGFFSDLKSKPHASPRNASLTKLLSYVGKSVADLVNAPEPNAVTFRMEGASTHRMLRDVPIYGTALGADEIVDGYAIEQTTLNRADIVEYKRRPPILDGRADVYGLIVQGASMDPVYRDGATVFVEGRKRPAVGDDAVVYLCGPDGNDGEQFERALIKRVLRKTAAYVELEQFNPPKIFRMNMDRVHHMDRVLTLDDLVG
jgi:hypothetical protein